MMLLQLFFFHWSKPDKHRYWCWCLCSPFLVLHHDIAAGTSSSQTGNRPAGASLVVSCPPLSPPPCSALPADTRSTFCFQWLSGVLSLIREMKLNLLFIQHAVSDAKANSLNGIIEHPQIKVSRLQVVFPLTDRAPAVSPWRRVLSPAPPAGTQSSWGGPESWQRPHKRESLLVPAELEPEASTALCGGSLPPSTPPFPPRSSHPPSERFFWRRPRKNLNNRGENLR